MTQTFDFDAWIYGLDPSGPSKALAELERQERGDAVHPTGLDPLPLKECALVADDIKFAFNAWNFLRLSLFFGCRPQPRVLSALTRTTPSMDVAFRGNRVFHMMSEVKAKLDPTVVTVGLSACPTARPIDSFDFKSILRKWPQRTNLPHHAPVTPSSSSLQLQLVVGMENGMSEEVLRQCHHTVYIPQYGSVGSLSMLTALGIAAHRVHTAVNGSCIPIPPRAGTDRVEGGASHASSTGTADDQQRNRPIQLNEKGLPLPHTESLLHLTNPEISHYLKGQRGRFPLQLGMLWHNDIGDRNIGACIRNANAYNCEKMILINRRKFNLRGSVGTHHYLDLLHFPSAKMTQENRGISLSRERGEALDLPEGKEEIGLGAGRQQRQSKAQGKPKVCPAPNAPSLPEALEGWACWEIHQYYPYLQHHLNGINSVAGLVEYPLVRHSPDLQTFIRPVPEGVITSLPPSLAGPPVLLDDEGSVLNALRDVQRRKLKGVMLVVPDEGSTLRTEVRKLCERTVFVLNPTTMSPLSRGISAQISTGITLERLRAMMVHL
jgi:hypothetical protein